MSDFVPEIFKSILNFTWCILNFKFCVTNNTYVAFKRVFIKYSSCNLFFFSFLFLIFWIMLEKMGIRKWKCNEIFIIKSLIEFYIILDLEIICKMIVLHLLLKKQKKYEWLLAKKINWKIVLRMYYKLTEMDIPPKVKLEPVFFISSFTYLHSRTLKGNVIMNLIIIY